MWDIINWLLTFTHILLRYYFDSITDVDECLTQHGGCDSNATCTNTIGSHTCQCNTGFSGNGTHCSGK